jgi:hypothetical protein
MEPQEFTNCPSCGTKLVLFNFNTRYFCWGCLEVGLAGVYENNLLWVITEFGTGNRVRMAPRVQ